VVGAPSDDYNGFYDVGSVYIFVRNGVTWTHQAKLEAPDPASKRGLERESLFMLAPLSSALRVERRMHSQASLIANFICLGY